MLWNQIEAEIHLHRHKTVIRACRGRKNPFKKTPAPPAIVETEEVDADSKARRRRGIGDTRTVVMTKSKNEGLGISITVSSQPSIHFVFVVYVGHKLNSNNFLPGW